MTTVAQDFWCSVMFSCCEDIIEMIAILRSKSDQRNICGPVEINKGRKKVAVSNICRSVVHNKNLAVTLPLNERHYSLVGTHFTMDNRYLVIISRHSAL